MSIYVVTGTLGSGKTLVTVGRIRDALAAGKTVATNLDLNLEFLHVAPCPARVVRLPDFPSVTNLHDLGRGNDSRDESKNGLIVLDEAGTFLNSRSWNDKQRHELVAWLLHTRKLGWDVYLIVQDVSMLDRQVRVALVEHLVICRRMDRIPIPFLGKIIKAVSFSSGRFPRVHVATVKYGSGVNAIVVDRWWYRGDELFPAYDTRQVFKEDADQVARTLLCPRRAPWLLRPPMSFRWRVAEACAASRFRLLRTFGQWLVSAPGCVPSGPWVDYLLHQLGHGPASHVA